MRNIFYINFTLNANGQIRDIRKYAPWPPIFKCFLVAPWNKRKHRQIYMSVESTPENAWNIWEHIFHLYSWNPSKDTVVENCIGYVFDDRCLLVSVRLEIKMARSIWVKYGIRKLSEWRSFLRHGIFLLKKKN